MCGINGAVAVFDRAGGPSLRAAAEIMTSALKHRGPDASGIWTDSTGRAALGHTRLAIVDLSEAGAQPMTSSDGRWTITYNGELYNAAELRKRLGPFRWQGRSDTEVLLEYIAHHGVQAVLEAAKGMFAFGCWDARKSEFWLARDRFGEKPVYYAWHRGTFLFASELKALLLVPGLDPAINRQALQEYFRWTNVPAPMSIFEGVNKLPPAHCMRVESGSGDLSPRPYWSVIEAASAAPVSVDGVDVLDCLSETLDRAVAAQMVSDVPLGAFLSGGVDSSSVVAAMQRQSSTPVRTFSIGFTEASYDESGYAAEVATVLGTDHTELVVSPSDAMGVIPHLPTVYDEPFADSSQIPTLLVSRMAREKVTVALSGDGGDELFGGYNRYQEIERIGRFRTFLPSGGRRIVGAALRRLPVETWDRLGRGLPQVLVPSGLRHRTGHRIHKVARLLAADPTTELYAALMSITDQDDQLVLGVEERPISLTGISSDLLWGVSPFERSMLIDTLTYLPGDLLTKVDRASMSVSLEVRVPFLDPDLFQFAWGLSHSDRVREGQGKWILRELLRRDLPDNLIDRPKMGFGIPVGQWLRGPLRSWADDLLDPTLVREQGFLDPTVVQQRWLDHRDGRADLTFQIWSILMFQAWLVGGLR